MYCICSDAATTESDADEKQAKDEALSIEPVLEKAELPSTSQIPELPKVETAPSIEKKEEASVKSSGDDAKEAQKDEVSNRVGKVEEVCSKELSGKKPETTVVEETAPSIANRYKIININFKNKLLLLVIVTQVYFSSIGYREVGQKSVVRFDPHSRGKINGSL